jgi:adenosylmethionine-8-amino-7-oxononanoate aminotransferase
MTLGHRVLDLDQALRDQLDRVAHSTLLGNGNRIVIELAEALARLLKALDGLGAAAPATPGEPGGGRPA